MKVVSCQTPSPCHGELLKSQLIYAQEKTTGQIFIPKVLRGIYRTDLTWTDQNLGRKVEVKYMNKPCNAC